MLIGGVIFSISGSAISNKADEAYSQMLKSERIINDICSYLKNLREVSQKYYDTLLKVNDKYDKWFKALKTTVNSKTDWNAFSAEEKLNAENTVLSVGMLYEMCKVKLVLTSKTDSNKNSINHSEIGDATAKATMFLDSFGY